MRIVFLSLIFFLLIGCNSNKYIFKDRFIDKLGAIPRDSIIIIAPVLSMWRFSGNRDFNFPSIERGRPDTVRKFLKQVFLQKNLDSSMYFKIDASCIRHKLNSANFHDKPINEPAFYKCLKIDSSFYNIFFYFSLDVTEVAGGSSEEFSNIDSYILILKNGQILYYKHYNSRRRSLRKNFPRGSIDRKEFPHFTNEQIKLVVNKITEDLMKKIK